MQQSEAFRREGAANRGSSNRLFARAEPDFPCLMPVRRATVKQELRGLANVDCRLGETSLA